MSPWVEDRGRHRLSVVYHVNYAKLNERLIEELERRNAELERFTYTVSHNLRSPLVTVRGFVDLLEKDVAAVQPERVAADLARIRGATSTMEKLLRELLELSRVGRVMNPPERISLDELARQACGSSRSGAPLVRQAHGVETQRNRTIQCATKASRTSRIVRARILDGTDELYAARGKKVERVDLRAGKPDKATVERLMLRSTGNLRAPTLRVGRTLVVGFDEATYRKVLG